MKIPVYLEIGSKRVLASALDWPGLCRSGRDEETALSALFDASPRYAYALALASIDFPLSGAAADFEVIERLPGGSAADFGVPQAIPSVDERPFLPDELHHAQAILTACWQAFDLAAQKAFGKELRKGPRGGGRELDGIVRHVMDSAGGYLSQVGIKLQPAQNNDPAEKDQQIRQAVLDALEYASGSDYPNTGPRGGRRWPARYFTRRVAWHILDHAWEIEDRI